jgi:Ca-activated chloride channel family protein
MFYRSSAAHVTVRAVRPRKIIVKPLLLIPLLLAAGVCARAQGGGFERELVASGPVNLSVKNRLGRVTVTAVEGEEKKVSIRARAPLSGVAVEERDVKIEEAGGRLSVVVERESSASPSPNAPAGARPLGEADRNRIDVVVTVPARTRVEVETEVGAVDVVGPLAEARVTTGTGTIRADVPTDAVRYSLRWTLSRPRVYSEVELGKVKEQRSGTFEISGRLGDKKAKQDARVELSLETARGVILFGVADERAVPSDLRERELTEAARAVIRSGDADLTDAIRKIVPRLVGEYAETLPPTRFEPTFSARRNPFDVRTSVGASLARLNASVTDRNGRAVGGLSARDFTVVENGEERSVRAVEPSTAPFNLVLLLDVSGSVEERLDFIRKAALAFVDTVGPNDRVAITSFRDDVQVISEFTTDRAALARRIKDIQAGGATSLYDALAYTLVHTLKPLRGERTAVVILSDGDDNRSFIPFTELLEAVLESGALIYPLYVPSGLIPSSSAAAPASTIDPMRTRFLTLTSRAREEGRRLAELSGGVYYPITRLEQLQQAYDDVAAQLRTSYSITYESSAGAGAATATTGAPRVRVRVAREGASVRLSPSVGVNHNTPAAAP